METPRYAVYVRVSTEKDEQISSIQNQIDICRNWIERQGWEWREESVFKDDGYTGTILVDRPAMQVLLEKARNYEIDIIVFKSIHRLARDLKDALEIREIFQASRARIISVEEGYDSQEVGKNDMSYEMWSMFAAQYSRTVSSSTSAAFAAKVRRGEHAGRVPYGYDRVDNKLVIKEEEAKIVRLIFDLYTEKGWGMKRITYHLNKLGIKPKKNDKWQFTSVQRILQNQTYTGRFVYNRYTKIKVAGRKKQIENPREKWIIYEDHHPRIISDEQFNKANSNRDHKVKLSAWNELRGIAKCAHCGSRMVISQSSRKKKDGSITRWRYLKCSKYFRSGECVAHEPLPYEKVRDFLLNILKKKGESIDLTLKNDIRDKQDLRMKQLNEQLGKLQVKKDRLLELYMDAFIDKSEYQVKRSELEAEIEKISKEVRLLEKDHQHKEVIENVLEAFKQLENPGEDLKHVFDTLLDKVEIHQDGTLDPHFTFSIEEPV
ncbi:recombinase family protein [Halalkalibacterium halodurans]|uniref:recombinase family protein n=1 Tax=Halalkalibacterium halodurans TaxID=86665 RepID=UPI002E20F9B6|nr:recombinase family protein [Halalkalibacterium halodurans]